MTGFFKNSNWTKANLLAIYNLCWTNDPETNPASGQGGTWTQERPIASAAH